MQRSAGKKISPRHVPTHHVQRADCLGNRFVVVADKVVAVGVVKAVNCPAAKEEKKQKCHNKKDA
jgi:hypothetical protein